MDWKRYFSKNVLSRGENYFYRDCVMNFKKTKTVVTAIVEGSDYYHVRIEYPGTDKMYMYCTCPHAYDGFRCKHMAAVMFKWQTIDIAEQRQKNLIRNPIPPAEPGKEPFYHMARIASDFTLMRDDLDKARDLIRNGSIRLTSFARRYERYYAYNSVGPVSQVSGEYEDEQYVYGLDMIFDTEELKEYYCSVCDRQHYKGQYYGYGKREYELCPHMMALLLLADDYTKKYDPGDYTDFKAMQFLRMFDRERIRVISEDRTEVEGSVILEPRIVESITGHDLSFRIGNGGKMFVVRNLTDLHDAVNERKKMTLGKSADIDFASETFNEESGHFFELIEKEVKRRRRHCFQP